MSIMPCNCDCCRKRRGQIHLGIKGDELLESQLDHAAKVEVLEAECRAYRNRFISERVHTYQNDWNGHDYEMATALAESDANDFIDGFRKAMAKRKAT